MGNFPGTKLKQQGTSSMRVSMHHDGFCNWLRGSAHGTFYGLRALDMLVASNQSGPGAPKHEKYALDLLVANTAKGKGKRMQQQQQQQVVRVRRDEKVICSSIAMLQERFRRLEKVKEMREERELLNLINNNSNNHHQLQFLHPKDDQLLTTLSLSLSLSLWPNSQLKHHHHHHVYINTTTTPHDVVDTTLHL
ncbi:hypothetical protein L1987_28345 [Smallanthus sonchifolius]|uniref:Uncharacterized protein n=1 Tax=Smallanthus sonchifolius TaxID=185202 RepID=A0ACB9HW88_9ASTR|nr:hypothetical protein L1987_28345 [Smallanthus sonchifolius]